LHSNRQGTQKSRLIKSIINQSTTLTPTAGGAGAGAWPRSSGASGGDGCASAAAPLSVLAVRSRDADGAVDDDDDDDELQLLAASFCTTAVRKKRSSYKERWKLDGSRTVHEVWIRSEHIVKLTWDVTQSGTKGHVPNSFPGRDCDLDRCGPDRGGACPCCCGQCCC